VRKNKSLAEIRAEKAAAHEAQFGKTEMKVVHESVNWVKPPSPRRQAVDKETQARYYADHSFIVFQQQLAKIGKEVEIIPGDGNCLFRSCAL